MKPRETRRRVIIQARMRHDGGWRDVCIRNISSRGMLLQAATAPARGSYIEIFRARHVIIGRVVWSKDRRFGVQTQDRMDIEALVQPPAPGAGNCRRASDRPDAAPATCETAAVTIQRRLDRSRRLSAAFQFGLFVISAGTAAVVAVGAVHNVLAEPMNRISAALGG